MPCNAMHPMRDYFWKGFYMQGTSICNLYALYGTTGIMGVEAITATVLKMTRLPRTTCNACEAFHPSSLIYRLVDPY
jgi:hypothetical protein